MARSRWLSADLLITLLFLALFVWAIWQSQLLRWPFRAALFPVLTSAVILGIVLLKLGLDVWKLARAPRQEVVWKPAQTSHPVAVAAPAPALSENRAELRKHGAEEADPALAQATEAAIIEEEAAAEAEAEDIFATAGRPVWAQALGWMTLFFFMTWVLGLIITVPLFALLYLLLASRERPLVAIVYAAASWTFVFVLFDQVLHIPLPKSLVPPLAALGL